MNPFQGHGSAMPAREVLVCDLVALYLRHSEKNGVHCPQAFEERKRTLQDFAHDHGPCPVHQLRPFHLTDWIDGHPRWGAPATRLHKCDLVKAAFQWAVDQERIIKNPFRSIHLPQGDRRPDMPDDVFARLCAAANRPLEYLLRFLRLVGCRIGEACRAEWTHFDLDQGIWTVPKHKTMKITRKPKRKALVPEAVELLRQIKLARGCHTHVFLNVCGRPMKPQATAKTLKALRERLGLGRYTLHSIRHRYGSAWVANRGSIKMLAEQLGHGTTQTTERYYVDMGEEIDAIREEAKLAVPRVLKAATGG